VSSSPAVQKAGTRTCKEAKARSQDYWPTRAFFCRRLSWSRQMLDNQGFEILHNGVPRTFRDKRETAFEAACYAKGKPGRHHRSSRMRDRNEAGHARGRQDGLARITRHGTIRRLMHFSYSH